jgi:uncharacterized protein YrzB (UPF0473 family)
MRESYMDSERQATITNKGMQCRYIVVCADAKEAERSGQQRAFWADMTERQKGEEGKA